VLAASQFRAFAVSLCRNRMYCRRNAGAKGPDRNTRITTESGGS
jgi:hypothetical protein